MFKASLRISFFTNRICDRHCRVLPVHAPVKSIMVGVLEAEPLNVEVVTAASRHDLVQLGHDRDEVTRHSLGRNPGYARNLPLLSADKLPGAVQHRQVVHHHVPDTRW